MFELLPETGLVLPRRVGLLRFGMPARAARWTVATLADVRESWVCGAGWTFSARYEGLELLVAGDCPDREGRTESARGLALVGLRRCERDPAGPSPTPVVLDGIDLFGYPAAEVESALPRCPVVILRQEGGYFYEAACWSAKGR